ncbi:MAG: nitroreductase family protein [Endomicrobia bacterium]|nr:nitroreductase family protein [Endomicrobiia bacterium]
MQSLTDLIKSRRSIRKYKNKPIPKEIILDIINCARFAPTANNKQPWFFVVVLNKGFKNKIAGITDYGKFIEEAYCLIAVFCEDTKYYLEDGCAATENILLAAWSYGIGSCWVAGDKKLYTEDVRDILGLDKKYKLVSLISLGYPEEKELNNVKKIKKKPLEKVISFLE